MSDDDIRALVERLKRLAPKCLALVEGEQNGSWIIDQAAAALTALAAERDAAREAYRLVTDCEPDARERRDPGYRKETEAIEALVLEARRAAFARAREIAEAQRTEPSGEPYYRCGFNDARAQIAAAIEAEMYATEEKT